MRPTVVTTISKTTTYTLNEEQAASIIRTALGVPHEADVTFNCGCDFLREITVRWIENKTDAGTTCPVCGEPQFETSSGVVCKNGHGGA